MNCPKCNADGKVIAGSACGECRDGKTVMTADAIKALLGQKPRSRGFLEARIAGSELCVSYGGNMGATVKTHVNPLLLAIGLPTAEGLLASFRCAEKGSPDYAWSLTASLEQ